MNYLKVRSCLIDGEVVCCDEKGVAASQLLRHRRNEPKAFLYAFDLLELNGADLRALPVGEIAGLAEVQESRCAGREREAEEDWGR
jgi:bifunctional non-homologous end joining protein LigD